MMTPSIEANGLYASPSLFLPPSPFPSPTPSPSFSPSSFLPTPDYPIVRATVWFSLSPSSVPDLSSPVQFGLVWYVLIV